MILVAQDALSQHRLSGGEEMIMLIITRLWLNASVFLVTSPFTSSMA